jgi:hypothetical protein
MTNQPDKMPNHVKLLKVNARGVVAISNAPAAKKYYNEDIVAGLVDALKGMVYLKEGGDFQLETPIYKAAKEALKQFESGE